ncbi:MAG: hypothetical protein DLM70_14585 [Chloroflexi bacterium]|nr:MAG: hypothetical protein DLM70_14585 [Chloroflexota bacterium]
MSLSHYTAKVPRVARRVRRGAGLYGDGATGPTQRKSDQPTRRRSGRPTRRRSDWPYTGEERPACRTSLATGLHFLPPLRATMSETKG